jgi:outer membrane protein W
VTASAIARSWISVSLVLGAASAIAMAGDVEKRWRLGLGIGGFNPQGEIDSAAANQLLLIDPTSFEPRFLFRDPRDDSSAFGNLDIQAGHVGRFDVQYAPTKIFVLEGSVGYEKTDLGDAEVSVEFLGSSPPIAEIPTNFTTFRIPVGEIERVPIQLTGLARFRPRASFNPYFGGGIGYSIHGFEPTAEFNELSVNMDRSLGQLVTVTDSFNGSGGLGSPVGDPRDLGGAEVDVRDSFEWHLVAGAELSFKKKWAAFADVRWIDASRDVTIRFDNATELGKSVPNFEDFTNSAIALEVFGPIDIGLNEGGLIDGGQRVWVRRTGQPETTICDLPGDDNQELVCEFVWFTNDQLDDPRLPDDFEADGLPDPGSYYVQGGKLEYDGFQLLFGVRYTF